MDLLLRRLLRETSIWLAQFPFTTLCLVAEAPPYDSYDARLRVPLRNPASSRSEAKDSLLAQIMPHDRKMPSNHVSDHEALQFLASQGYLPLQLADHDGLVDAYSALFQSSAAYFNLPDTSLEKTSFRAPSGVKASEQGYSDIVGEKSILTVKSHEMCPAMLHEQLNLTWNLTGAFLESICKLIANTLQLDPDVFTPFIEPCCKLPQGKGTPTMLRLFRYNRPVGEEAVVAAEQHEDLGILSLVVGNSPGLQVLNTAANVWVPIEEDTVVPKDAKIRSGGMTATLLCGETMAFLTRNGYKGGVHRVLCAPAKDNPYRFSIVFALRPAAAPIFTKNFESAVVGEFSPDQRLDGQSAALFMQQMIATHWNVNVAKDVREEQQGKFRAQAQSFMANGQEHIEDHAPPPGPPPGRASR